MQIMDTALPEIKVLMPQRIGDTRGFFSEVWNARDFAAVGIDAPFVQDNHVRNPTKGTLRGLHYQVPTAAQASWCELRAAQFSTWPSTFGAVRRRSGLMRRQC
jgi:dTDP-4-dehydrorhamnose 3,5-epimerase-like enzyme